MKQRKVFNIGFHKTGTTSLTQFVSEHGYRALHSVSYSMQNLGLGKQDAADDGDGTITDLYSLIEKVALDKLVRQFDYFSDNPWPLLFRQLDQAYPGSLFILTRRKVDDWLSSLLRHTGNENTRMRQLIYGYGNPHRHVSRYREVYLLHNRAVQAYFDGRDNFLLIDLEKDDYFIAQRLREFLGIESSGSVFPSLNKGSIRTRNRPSSKSLLTPKKEA